MHLERIVVGFSIGIVVFAIAYAGSAAISTRPPAPAPAVAQPLDAAALAKKLGKLEQRLADAQHAIDAVLATLANANDSDERDATRVRLDVLYRLERGLLADIARTREELQSRSTARVEGAWHSHGNTNR